MTDDLMDKLTRKGKLRRPEKPMPQFGARPPARAPEEPHAFIITGKKQPPRDFQQEDRDEATYQRAQPKEKRRKRP